MYSPTIPSPFYQAVQTPEQYVIQQPQYSLYASPAFGAGKDKIQTDNDVLEIYKLFTTDNLGGTYYFSVRKPVYYWWWTFNYPNSMWTLAPCSFISGTKLS
jgi:hypothetical protein